MRAVTVIFVVVLKKAESSEVVSSSKVSEGSILLQESVIRGHHVFKEIWTPRLGEILLVNQDAGNAHNRCAVALLKANRTVVGHVPMEFASVFWHFLACAKKMMPTPGKEACA